ncbi:MAG: hypothetical protein CML24_09750 [Rhizobiales bacterium]|nr:hypothetical protein [Hyphomicrobiales bacterium]|tara:strand:- start:4036 stop:4725 length:690 start_codon:yes stop_codon:yes gene_type:complete
MFGKPSINKEYSKLITQLETGERNQPTHVRPRAVTDNGLESFATPGVQAVFEGFEFFGVLLNRQVSDPWTIEETGETRVRDVRSDSPELGRTYTVYFNGVRLGRIQVTEGFQPEGINKPLEWHRENRAARIILDLAWMRFVPYDDAFSLLYALELLLARRGKDMRDRARHAATAALTGYVWEALRVDDIVPDLLHWTEGPYDLLVETSAHWKESGIDPFTQWDGDRSHG